MNDGNMNECGISFIFSPQASYLLEFLVAWPIYIYIYKLNWSNSTVNIINIIKKKTTLAKKNKKVESLYMETFQFLKKKFLFQMQFHSLGFITESDTGCVISNPPFFPSDIGSESSPVSLACKLAIRNASLMKVLTRVFRLFTSSRVAAGGIVWSVCNEGRGLMWHTSGTSVLLSEKGFRDHPVVHANLPGSS